MNIDLTKTQQYLEWFKNKLYLNAIAISAKNRIVYRGQVYRRNLGVGIGSEECKEQPCVVLQYNSANRTSPNTLVAPITHTTSIFRAILEPQAIFNEITTSRYSFCSPLFLDIKKPQPLDFSKDCGAYFYYLTLITRLLDDSSNPTRTYCTSTLTVFE